MIDQEDNDIKLVELNTIAVGGGPISDKVKLI
jgi:glutathione synthase